MTTGCLWSYTVASRYHCSTANSGDARWQIRYRFEASEHPGADGDGGDRGHEVADERRRHGVARAADADGAEVHRQDVERRLRRPVHRRGGAREERVGAVGLDEVGREGQRAAAGERAQDGERHELGREARGGDERPQGPRSARSIAPEPRNMPIATRMPTRNGMILTATSKPSFAPSMKTS